MPANCGHCYLKRIMEIKNIFDETVNVTDLYAAIEETNKLLGFARDTVKKQKVPAPIYIERGDKKATLVSYHSHKLKELMKLLPITPYPDWLFVGVYPCCYVYCDKRKEENRDFKEVLRLFYSPLHIKITAANKKAYPDVLELAKVDLKRLKMRFNEPLEISATGQTTGLSLSASPDVVVK